MRPDVVIDASNVARDPTLGGSPPPGKSALFPRYLAVCDAWRSQFDPAARIVGLADANLRHEFSESDASAFEELGRRGEVETVHGNSADARILDLAKSHNAKVVSKDNYADFRKTDGSCWIQGNTDQFFRWQGLLSNVQIVLRDMGFVSAEDIERKQREGRDKARRANTQARRKELENTFRCPSPKGDCAYALESLPESSPPVYGERGGAPLCPSCRRVLIVEPRASTSPGEGGERVEELRAKRRAGSPRRPNVDLADTHNWPPTSACLQLWRRGEERQRIELPAGQRLVLGRTRHVVDLQPYAEGDGVFLSREHAAIELKVDGSAFVEDLGSANGTWLRDVELKPYVRCEVGDCDEVTLAGDVLTVVYWAPRARPE